LRRPVEGHGGAGDLQLRCHPTLPGRDLPLLRNGHRLLHPGVLAISVSEPPAEGERRLWPVPEAPSRFQRRGPWLGHGSDGLELVWNASGCLQRSATTLQAHPQAGLVPHQATLCLSLSLLDRRACYLGPKPWRRLRAASTTVSSSVGSSGRTVRPSRRTSDIVLESRMGAKHSLACLHRSERARQERITSPQTVACDLRRRRVAWR
jgi:hypothetical protein